MSKVAKRISAAFVALILAVGVVGSTLALAACGSKDDFNGFYASATYGVTLIVGQTFTLSNCNVYGMTGKEADSDNDVCIAGMRASEEDADTVILLDASGNPTDGIEITSSSQTVTLQYTGERYTYPEGEDTFTYTISAEYATSAEVVPYTVGRSGGAETYATVGDGASAMSVVVYYEGGSDTHADCEITISHDVEEGETDENAGELIVGKNYISATSVCKTSSGENVEVIGVTVTISEIAYAESGTNDSYHFVVTGDGYTGETGYTVDQATGVAVGEYRFYDATKGGSDCTLWMWTDGRFAGWGMFGDETAYGLLFSMGQTSGTTVYWGQLNNEFTIVRGVGSTSGTTYYICETVTNEDGSVTFSDSHGSSAVSVTFTAAELSVFEELEGYDLSTLTIESAA